MRHLAKTIAQKLETDIITSRSGWTRRNPIASDAPGPGTCLRYQQLLLLHPDKTHPQFPPDLLLRFERGAQIGKWNARKLGELGFEVVEHERPFEIREGSTVLISGRVDVRVKWQGASPPVEIKTVSPHVFSRLRDPADFERWPWTQRYIWQLQLYIRFCQQDYGVILLDDCLGHWRPIEVEYDQAVTDTILENCRVIMKGVQAVQNADNPATREAELEGYHRDPRVCKQCPCFATVCHPPIDKPQHDVEVLDDPDLIMTLERREQLKPAHEEFEAIDADLKARFRGRNVMCGPWHLTGKWRSLTRYEIPDDIKAQYKMVNPQGAWVADYYNTGETHHDTHESDSF